jgi:hypothetical protein
MKCLVKPRGHVVGRRIVLLLSASMVMIVACDRAVPERPREGAPAVTAGRPVTTGAAVPTLAPPVALGRPPPAVNNEQPSPPTPTPAPKLDFVIGATGGMGANLRTEPSMTAPILTTLREGTLVDVLGDPVSVDGRSWRQIRSEDREGWVVAVVVLRR